MFKYFLSIDIHFLYFYNIQTYLINSLIILIINNNKKYSIVIIKNKKNWMGCNTSKNPTCKKKIQME